MRRPHKGFAVIELLVLVIVPVVVAMCGYWVWHKHTKKSNPPTAFTKPQQSETDKAELANINFQLYSYQTPATIFSRSVSNLYKPRTFVEGNDPNFQYNNPKYAHLVESYKLNGVLLQVNQFKTNLYGGGPATCTPIDPEFPDLPLDGYKCTQVGTTNTNTPIYATLSAVDQSYTALFTSIGSTTVAEQITFSKPGTNSALLTAMKSLKPIDKADLRLVYPTTAE